MIVSSVRLVTERTAHVVVTTKKLIKLLAISEFSFVREKPKNERIKEAYYCTLIPRVAARVRIAKGVISAE